MKEKRLGVCVVGCGKIARSTHLPILARADGFRLVALTDVDNVVLRRVGDQYDVPHLSTSYEDVIHRSDVDVVAILTQDHADIAVAAAAAGKHMFIEKPLAYSVKDADRIVDAVKASGTQAQVGYMKYYDRGFNLFVDRIAGLASWDHARVTSFGGQRRHDATTSGAAKGPWPEPPRVDLGLETRRELGERGLREYLGGDAGVWGAYYGELLNFACHDLAAMRHTLGDPTGVASAAPFGKGGLCAVFEYGCSQSCVFEINTAWNHPGWQEDLTVWSGDRLDRVSFGNPFVRHDPSSLVSRVLLPDGDARSTYEEFKVYDAFSEQWFRFWDSVTAGKPVAACVDGARRDVALILELVATIAGARDR